MRALRLLAFIVASALVAATGVASARELVAFDGYAPGTIVVKTQERTLYFVAGRGRAWRYPVGVGRAGKTWAGHAYVEQKLVRPAWIPPRDIKRENPQLPDIIPGGAPSNPMGAAVLALNVNDYAIHGTNRRESIGHFVSYGCIRMYNEDIVDLYGKVRVGTPVIVLR
jgi:lipoprotein-anchoring transpeptidase ErfK/SrfK